MDESQQSPITAPRKRKKKRHQGEGSAEGSAAGSASTACGHASQHSLRQCSATKATAVDVGAESRTTRGHLGMFQKHYELNH